MAVTRCGRQPTRLQKRPPTRRAMRRATPSQTPCKTPAPTSQRWTCPRRSRPTSRAMLTGSIGMLPSASLGGRVALYEPVHGSAPDIAGQDKANPIATIASAAMMLHHSFGLEREAQCIESAIETVLENGCRTADIVNNGSAPLGTVAMGDAILACI